MPANITDLTQRPPRSPRVRLGGYCILPRVLDKGRALVAGKIGEYKFACPLDQQFLQFAGIDSGKLKKQLETGKGDGAILEWVRKNSSTQPAAAQILAWSMHQEQRAPSDTEARKYFNDLHEKVAPQRDDLTSWFDLLDADDFGSFGGKV
jgi:hypothetical protein